MRAIASVLLLLTLGFIGLFGFATWRGLPQNEKQAARGGEITVSELGFTVERSTYADRLGQPDADVVAAGRFVCVDVRVANRGTVNRFPRIDLAAALIDERGRSFRVDAAATGVLRRADPVDDPDQPLAPGLTRVTHLAFDVPVDAADLRLRFEVGGPLGNVINRALYGNSTLALE